MAGPMDKSKLKGLLIQAKIAAVTVHEIRDRMLQLQVRLQAHTTAGTATTPTPGGASAAQAPSEVVAATATGTTISSGGAGAALPSKDVTATGTTISSGGAGAAPLPSKDVSDTTTTTPGDTGEARSFEDEINSGFLDAYMGLDRVARCMTTCLTMAASSGVPPSLPIRFAVISDEQLYEEMLALRLPERPTTQRHAFARLEAAFYAVKLPQEHHLQRCSNHLRRRPHQARTYLGRACTCASLAATHIDLAVTALESIVDPQDVAEISDFATRTATRHLSHQYR